MDNESSFGWDMIMSFVPRVMIFAVCIFIVNVAGSVAQMCFSDFTIGTCTNPEYIPMHYTYTAAGSLMGAWVTFLYNIWTTDPSEDSDVIE